MLELLNKVELKIKTANTEEDVNLYTVSHSYFTSCYVLSLRGGEGFLIDLEILRYYWNSEMKDKEFGQYFYLTLSGKVK